jgi:hypothetical protein
MWLYTTDPTIPQNMWTPIPNTNAPFYDPGPLTESTWFVRCVRAIGCVKFLESNHILIEVVENAEGFCQPGSVGGFSLELPSLIEGTTTGRYILSPDDRKFITYADGTAKLEGLFIHTQNSNQRWEASIRLVQKEDWGQWSATGGTYQGGVANALHPTWDYYEIDPANSTLTGKQKFKNKVLNLQPLSATSGFQVGHGANTQDGGRGFFSGFSYTGSYTGTGTMRASLTDCQDVCSPAPLLAGRVLLEGAYDPADGGMETTLASQNQLPLNQPFNVAPWFYTGSESVTVMPDSIVDWVLIEVRDHVDPSVVEGRFAALLTEHGEVRALDGYSLADLGLEAGQYYISVQSPNHLGIMSDVTVNQYGRVLLYDFTAPDAVYEETCIPGTAAEELEPGVFGMIQGDVDGNGVINSVDIQIIINNQTVSGNVRTDLNGDGITDASDLQQALLRYFRRTHIPQN